ncbi:MAG: ABC transporter ATP-binding protein [Planctomycetales bacterium]|nr:ABC transporter ATP-binding protein [Planctomycetales bacterium]
MSKPLVPPLLETRGLCKTFPDGQVQALVDVNLRIDAGEFVAIMGPSGSGKSTLLSLLGALDRPTRGSILFSGTPYSEWKNLDQLRALRMGFVFQSFFLLPTLTATENVQVPMFETDRSPRDRQHHATELLEVVGLSHRARHLPTKLSIGERQRVAIARSLANDPAILFADEPTGNLDSKNADDIMTLFRQLHADRAMTIVMVTHSDEIARYAQRLLRVRDGRIESDQPAGAL